MEVLDRCGGVGAGVHNRAEAGLAHALELGDLRHHGQHMAEHLGRDAVAQIVVVLLRDDQGVHGGLGLDVVEREADIVLVHLVRGDLPGDEFAEQAVIGHLRFLSSKGCGGMAPIRTNSLPHGAASRPREPVAAGTSPPVSAYRCETTRSPMPAQPTTLSAGVAASFRSPVRQPLSSTSVTARRISSAASFMPKL